jgi:hypothetical protein
MRLLDKIENINESIESINKTISRLIVEQYSPNPFLNWWLRRKIRKSLTPDLKNDDSFSDAWDKWGDSDKKNKDIEDTIEDLKDKVGLNKDKEEEFREMLQNIADKQKKLVDELSLGEDFSKIRVTFNNPIDFEIKFGKEEGKELKLEGTKSFDIYNVKKKLLKKIIYFNYETNKENWLKDYNILFSIEIKDPKPNTKYERVTINIIYVDETALRNGEIEIIDEKILTHRSKIEIKSLK